MTESSAVIFIPDDTQKTGLEIPLFLFPTMGSPLLAWVVSSMQEAGCRRCFLACPKTFVSQAKACFPRGLELTVCDGQNPTDQLHVFLSTTPAEERAVTVLTAPVVYLPDPACRPGDAAVRRSGAFRAPLSAMMDALDRELLLGRFLTEHGKPKGADAGFYAVTAPEELLDWQKPVLRTRLRQLAGRGVQIWDQDACYISPTSSIGSGTQILPGTILRGECHVGENCVLGPGAMLEDSTVDDRSRVNASQLCGARLEADCTVGPYAHLRAGTVLKRGCHAGAFVEMKNAELGERVMAAHLAYLGDCTVGQDSNIGCGVATANFDRVEKHRVILGTQSFVGCNTSLVAPVQVGDGAYIAAGSVITQDVPPAALGIARARQVNKKDWASRHKK